MTYFCQHEEILNKAEQVGEDEWKRHISAFIQSFVVQSKRARWRHLCIEKPGKAQTVAAQMYADIMWERCERLDHRAHTALSSRNKMGVFYDFSGSARWLTPTQAMKAGHDRDSIYCIEEDKLALYFYHEMEDYLCKR